VTQTANERTWTQEEIHIVLEPLRHYIGCKIRHIKSNSYYRIRDVFMLEATMVPHFTYESFHRARLTFGRPVSELLDGRFEMMGS
jgi:hypothetical protein